MGRCEYDGRVRRGSMTQCGACGEEMSDQDRCPVCGTPASPVLAPSPLPPVAAAFPSLGGEGACRICGYSLASGDVTCAMCGAPAAPPAETAEALLCPVCGRSLGDDLARCEGCGVDLAAEDTAETPAAYACPLCAAPLRGLEEQCGSCDAPIWLDVERQRERAEHLRCPACLAIVDENAELCGRCGFAVWQETEEDLRSRADRAIADAGYALQYGRSEATADFSEAEKVLQTAEEAKDRSDFRLARKLAVLSQEVARSVTVQHKILGDAFRTAHAAMRRAAELGARVEQPERMLKVAHAAWQRGDSKLATRIALKARAAAEKLAGQKKRAPTEA